MSDEEEMAIASEVFHRVLVWCSQGKTLVESGQRLNVMLYILAPDLIGAATLDRIGSANGHSRQNIDKMVQDFRDTFGGQKSGTMKSDAARLAYQECQR